MKPRFLDCNAEVVNMEIGRIPFGECFIEIWTKLPPWSDGISQCNFLNDKYDILAEISLKLVPMRHWLMWWLGPDGSVTSHYLSQWWPWSVTPYGVTGVSYVAWPQALISMIFFHQLIPPCRIFASVNRVSISSDNDLVPIRRQAII